MQKLTKKPAGVVSIDSGRIAQGSQPLPPGSPAKANKKVSNRFTQAHAISAFFGRGLNVYQAARETGHSIADLQEQIRRIGYHAWERRIGRAA